MPEGVADSGSLNQTKKDTKTMQTLKELWDIALKTIWIAIFVFFAIWALRAMGEGDKCLHGHTPGCEHQGGHQ